jgi:hypothetical protein
VARLALRRELALEDHVHGDGGVVGAGHPQRVVTVHALVADEDVLEGIVEGVSPVKRAGDVGGRDDDAVGLLRRCRVGVEETALFPHAIPVRLDAARIVAVRDVSHDRSSF